MTSHVRSALWTLRAGAGRIILFLGRKKLERKRDNRIKLKVILKNRLTFLDQLQNTKSNNVEKHHRTINTHGQPECLIESRK